MTGYQRGTVAVGDLVTWMTHLGITTGRVLVVMPREHTEHVAVLAGFATAAEVWEEFGPLVLIECTTPDCVSCKGGWPGHEGWKHQANECQLECADADVEVALW